MKNQTAKKPKRDLGAHLELMGNGSPAKFIGVHAVPGRLPELLRYPGESAPAFCARALHHLKGEGVVVARLMYAAPDTGSLWSRTHAGNSDRVKTPATKFQIR